MVMSASKPMPDNEEEDIKEAVPESKLTSDSLAEGFQLFKTALDFFYNTAHLCRHLKLDKANDGRRIGTIEKHF